MDASGLDAAPTGWPSVSFPVLGLGASAGSYHPLRNILAQLRLDRFAVVVVQHLPPGGEERLAAGLVERLGERVHCVTAPMRLEQGKVYVAPGRQAVELRGGVLRPVPTEGAPTHLPIDTLFRSLGTDVGPRSMGCVLSGMASDGALGLQVIKGFGGLTFVQQPETAESDSMPRAAIDLGEPDFVGDPAAIAEALNRLVDHPYLEDPAAVPPTDEETLARIYGLLRDAFGHDLSGYKRGTILRRLERRMALARLPRVDAYVRLLASDPRELAQLYRDLLIGVTSFFRDGEPFEALARDVLPRILEGKRPGDALRVWVPGCATGEEAYSIAMVLLEVLGDRAPDYRLQVFGTDANDAAIQHARRGVYPPNVALDVSPERLARFFVAREGGYQVGRRLRSLVVFATGDVTRDPPYSRVDLVSCRNLLIYFQQPLQKNVLRIFHYALGDGGFLLLGPSESVADASDFFVLLDRHNKVYRKRRVAGAAAIDVTLAPRPLERQAPRPGASDQAAPLGVQQLADRQILERYGPPAVVVSEHHEVVHFRGKTGTYLEPAPGLATLSLFKLARPELALALRPALDAVIAGGRPVTVRDVRYTVGAELRTVDLELLPLDLPTGGRFVLVIFDEPRPTRTGDPDSVPAAPRPVDPGAASRVEQLEHDLYTARQYLQAHIDALEVSNEALHATNEQLQSANEELQSTNEELETSKEELQSTNEELTTVNTELQARLGDLGVMHDDLQNVLMVVDAAVLVVDRELRVRRASLAAHRLLGLRHADHGRALPELRAFAGAGDLVQSVRAAIGTVSPRTVVLRTPPDGSLLEVVVHPYTTGEHAIHGAVLCLSEPKAVPSAS